MIDAGYGDLIAAILAVIAALALYGGRSWAIPVVWVFNVWGTLDLLFAFYQGEIGVRIDPGSLGATPHCLRHARASALDWLSWRVS